MPRCIRLATLLLSFPSLLSAQHPTLDIAPMPAIVRFNATMREFGGPTTPGLRGMTLALYKDEAGGVPLWMETQTVLVDDKGRFSVLLGSTTTNGIPPTIFVTNEPRWIGITLDDGADRPRIQLTTVPYAFKAGDADTLSGKSSGDFVSQQQLNSLLPTLKRTTPNSRFSYEPPAASPSTPTATASVAPVVNTSNYPWAQQPHNAGAIAVGTNVVTLAPCPKGLSGADAWHYLYVSGTGAPEVVLLTGGSCRSRAANGTIEFSANYAHPAGFSIGTATAGLQEAVNDAEVTTTSGAISRQVMIDPGTYLLRARVSIRSSSITMISSGAILSCAMSDTCLMLGDPLNANAFQAIVLQGLRVAPAVIDGNWPAIEDNAQGSHINDFGPAASAVLGASFGSLVSVDNDQAAVIDGLSTIYNFAWGRCDITFCSTAIIGPGPYSKNAGVLWVVNSNISLQCGGNGIDNQDGNTLQVSNSVVQGYAQFGIRALAVFLQNTVHLSNVLEEEDGYCNPLGTGSSGIIVEGGQATTTASPGAGLLPQYANTGSIQVYYYVVVHSSTLGTSPAYIAGFANTNGSGHIQVLWNKVGTAGVITYDLLRIAGNGGATMAAPYGTGTFAVATGIPATLCSTQVCSFTDDAGSIPSSYTVDNNTAYWPSLKLWPGTVILTTDKDRQNSGGGNPTMLFTDSVTTGTIINSAGGTYPSVIAQECNPSANWSSIWMQCVGGNSVGNDYPPVVATLLQLSTTGSAPGGLKGRLIFELPAGAEVGPTHVITLSDSNPDKTLSTPSNRPSDDPNDSFIGYDGGLIPNKMQIALGSPVSISHYIGNTGDGINFIERLTAAQKEYRVPIVLAPRMFSKLPSDAPDGSMLYCEDCLNVADEGAIFDSEAAVGGHGTNLLREHGMWRVH